MIRIRAGKEKNLLRHHPWVFSGAIENEPSEAGIHEVVTDDGRFIAWGCYDPQSHIVLRLLSWDKSVFPDEDWWKDAVRQAVLRRRSFRLIIRTPRIRRPTAAENSLIIRKYTSVVTISGSVIS